MRVEEGWNLCMEGEGATRRKERGMTMRVCRRAEGGARTGLATEGERAYVDIPTVRPSEARRSASVAAVLMSERLYAVPSQLQPVGS